jgi:ABC-type sugar transport system ATPase subunit
MAEAAPILRLTEVTKAYGHVVALRDVSLALHAGEIVALVGDNGAGKSTLVGILSGVVQPDTGTIEVCGEETRLDDAHRAQALGIATVFQDLALVNRRDVAANLHLGREPRRYRLLVDRRKMLQDTADVIRRLGVGLPSPRTMVGDLSGGQRQAVAVARAVLRGGKAILLDEPTAALGIREGRRVVALVETLKQEGQAVLLVTHNMATVFEIADRIIVLRHGSIVASKARSDTSHDEVVSLIIGGHIAGMPLSPSELIA